MNWKYSLTGVAVGLSILIASLIWSPLRGLAQEGEAPPPAAADIAVGTQFTYQGYLDDGGAPAGGLYDFQFALYDNAAAGSQVGSTQAANAVTVNEGLFTVPLDFGPAVFGGDARWLQISVRATGGGAFTPLSPRQALTPAPVALSLPNVFTNEPINFVGVGRDFRISGNEVFGVRYDGAADDYGGMYVETAHANGWPFYGYATAGSFRAWSYYNGSTSDWHLFNSGIRLTVRNEGGLRIGPSADYSLVISNTTGSDGIRIYDTGDDAIQLGSDPDYSNYGLYIPSPGVSTYGLWPNTSEPGGDYALFTVDNISAANVTASALQMMAEVTGSQPLRVGDVVAVSGVAETLLGEHAQLPLVRAASAEYSGVIGVVRHRLLWEPAPGKEEEGAMSLQRADGAAQPGEYVALVIYGVAQVRVAPGEHIEAGDRLTAAQSSGQVRALQTRAVEGMTVTEGAQVVGIALEAPQQGHETIAVFVTLR